jgi:hypothetical protein
MAANHIPVLLDRLGGRRFSGWQAEVDATGVDDPDDRPEPAKHPLQRKENSVTAKEPADPTPPCVTDGTIQLGAFPQNPSTTQADAVMRVVSEHFGQQWYAVKLSGWWRILCPQSGVGWGADAGQRTRDFSRALAQATGLPVEWTVPTNREG